MVLQVKVDWLSECVHDALQLYDLLRQAGDPGRVLVRMYMWVGLYLLGNYQCVCLPSGANGGRANMAE